MILALVDAPGCARSPRPLEHDGPLVRLDAGRSTDPSAKVYGFRKGNQGCVGFERGNSRSTQCSALLGPKEVDVAATLEKSSGLVLGRVGVGIAKVELVTATRTLDANVEPGDREHFFAIDRAAADVDEVVLYGTAGDVVRRLVCNGRVGYPSLEACVSGISG